MNASYTSRLVQPLASRLRQDERDGTGFLLYREMRDRVFVSAAFAGCSGEKETFPVDTPGYSHVKLWM